MVLSNDNGSFTDSPQELIQSVCRQHGLNISSMVLEEAGFWKVTAVDESSDLREKIIVLFFVNGTQLNESKIDAELESIRKKDNSKILLYSRKDLREQVLKNLVSKGVTLLGLEGQKPHVQASEKKEIAKILDQVFTPTVGYEQAMKHFSDLRKKRALGLLGYSETVESVILRFAPIARYCFQRDDLKQDLSVYVNLNDCNLYWIHKGFGKKNPQLKQSNVFRRMMDLPEKSVKYMGRIFEKDMLKMKSMTQDEIDEVNRDFNYLQALMVSDLIVPLDSGKGFASKLIIPKFGDERLDIAKFSEIEPSFETHDAVDDIRFPPDGVLLLLKDFFNAEGRFDGVTYLSYYKCRYRSSDTLREDILYSIRLNDGK